MNIKGWSASLTIKEMKIKTTVRSHITPTKMTKRPTAGEDEEQAKFLHIVWSIK